jgi:hypothetical protein
MTFDSRMFVGSGGSFPPWSAASRPIVNAGYRGGGGKGAAVQNGAILYRPRADGSFKRHFTAAVVTHAVIIEDEASGQGLSNWFSVPLPGLEGYFGQWRVHRANQPLIYLLTREYRGRLPGMFPWEKVVEVVHASPDGFFPFEDSLYPADFSVERAVAMIDRYGLKEGRRGSCYLDNRLAYKDLKAEWGRLRGLSPFLRANFDHYDPMKVEGARIYFPEPGSAHYDAATKTVVSADGARLYSANDRWNFGIDRDGCLDRINATWCDPSGANRVEIVMRPHRGYRRGYGETRAVEIIRPGATDRSAAEPSLQDRHPTPSGRALADLVNLSVPIAGPHAGNMIVVDNRAYPGEWR